MKMTCPEEEGLCTAEPLDGVELQPGDVSRAVDGSIHFPDFLPLTRLPSASAQWGPAKWMPRWMPVLMS
jgi:hypothetical protein